MEDSFMLYNHRVKKSLDELEIIERAFGMTCPADVFKKSITGEWMPVLHPGYSITSRTFGEEFSNTNIATYAKLADIQLILLERLGLQKYAPTPTSIFHHTIAELVAGDVYIKNVSVREHDFLQALSSLFSDMDFEGAIHLETRGLSLFQGGFIIASFAAQDEDGYNRIISFRDAVYGNRQLRDFGVERKYKFFGHVTLAYIEEVLEENERKQLADTLIDINNRFFQKPLGLNIVIAEVRKFDIDGLYRRGGHPIFEFS